MELGYNGDALLHFMLASLCGGIGFNASGKDSQLLERPLCVDKEGMEE